MQKCQLCFSSTLTINQNNFDRYESKLQEIISRCGKYLSIDVLQTWNLTFDGDPFCEDCGENVRKLRLLDIQIEQVNNQIKQLLVSINAKISNERQNYQQTINYQNSAGYQNDFCASKSDDTAETSETTINPSNTFVTFGEYENSLSRDNFEDHPGQETETGISPAANNFENPQSKENTVTVKEKIEKLEGENVLNLLGPTKRKGVTSSDLQFRKSGAFECPNCTKKFSRLDLLKRHECESETYECDICKKSFSSQGSLQIHNRIHSGEKPHKCDICEKRFTLPHHLRLHLLTHSAERPYACKICNKRFKDKGYIKVHEAQHSQDESERRKYSCDICSKSFTLYQTLKNHLVRHTDDTSHKCKTCGKAFARSTVLRKHEKIHTNEKNFKCNLCWKSFLRESGLTEHMLTHKADKKFQCDQCGQGFVTIPRLNGHIRLKHADEGQFVCDICGRLYKTQFQLNQHRRHHFNKPPRGTKMCSCIVCGRSYSNENDMVKHQRVAHVVTTIISINCEKCNQVFVNQKEYHYHNTKRIPTKTSPFQYKCDLCNTTFLSKCEMIVHFNENHTESELPFKCSHCSSAFVGRKDLWRHREICEVKPTKKKGVRKHRKVDGKNKKKDSSRKSISKKILRRSGRVKKKVISVNKTEPEESDDSRNGNSSSDHQNFSDDETESDVKIKTENVDWIKQEPDCYLDSE